MTPAALQTHHMHFDVIRLYDDSTPVPQVIKVGILPFARIQDDLKILVMKPFAEKEILGNPQFQIAKGTRRININGNWCDMRLDDLHYADESFHEPLIDTALREGSEEVGLKAQNIKTVYDLGGFTFISASRGIKKPLHMFAADVLDMHDFGEYESTTSEVNWFTPQEFESRGRPDHALIINEAARRLHAHITLKAL